MSPAPNDSPSSGPQEHQPGAESASAERARYKRQIAQLEEEVEISKGLRKAKKKITVITMGRGIRRLSTMFQALDLLIFEADRRASQEEEEPNQDEAVKAYQNRTYKAFTILLNMVPSLRTSLNNDDSSPEEFEQFVALLQRGANGGRGDDIRNVKAELGNWLNTTYSPKEPFDIKSRAGRGFQNDITGGLLCPIDYDWDDEKTRLDIKAGRISVKDDLCLSCFYPQGKGDHNDLEAKFLRSSLLVKTYCVIFTSPTSAQCFEDEETEEGPVRKKGKSSVSQKKATKANVANILHMNGTVTPRSIAYAAVLLAFNFTDAAQWVEVYNNFSYPVLWEFIVDFFEDPIDDNAARRANELLAWWNKKVFPQHHSTDGVTNSSKTRNKLNHQQLMKSQR
ncbi:hypothetical protein BJ165DRAFT_1523966 [Panaeolus papilionaceus]|nr:hypothetical protein BJ165DRAFT_1523966 [Panaeolus papilionaceus]